MLMKETQHIAHMARHRAEKYNNRTAFKYKQGDEYAAISWTEVIKQSDQVSRFLIKNGISPDDKVGIYSQNRPQWTISDLAILSIRAVVVPVYPTAAFSQLQYIIEETEMSVLFVGDDEQLPNALQALEQTSSLKHIVTFDCKATDNDRVTRFEDILTLDLQTEDDTLRLRLSEATASDLATIIYTSGTTGEPKGAMLQHKQFMHAFKIHENRLSLSDKDVSFCFLPLSHVFERTWTYLIMYNGATNVYNLNPKQVVDELPKVKPTVMCVVPRFFEKTYDAIQQTAERWPKAQKAIFNWAIQTGHQYIEYQKDNRKAPLILQLKGSIANALVYKKVRQVFGGNIRFIPCAGSALNNYLLRFFHSIGLFICYGYGATETTATVSCMPMSNYDFNFTGDIMPGIEVKINEDNMILVKGDTIFKGYYKKPSQTAEVLKDGWYYTGDQGSIPLPGKLHMTERIKDIIKTSTGKYISPQKIELQLSQSEKIEQICVIGDNRKYLTALIVPALETIKQQKQITLEEEIQTDINKLQVDLPKHEHVVKIKVLGEPFSIDNTMLTNSLKVRRKQVNQIYKEQIEAMY